MLVECCVHCIIISVVLVRPFSAGYVNPPRGSVMSASPKVDSACAAKRPFVRDLFNYSHSEVEKESRLSPVPQAKGWVVWVLTFLTRLPSTFRPKKSPPVWSNIFRYLLNV